MRWATFDPESRFLHSYRPVPAACLRCPRCFNVGANFAVPVSSDVDLAGAHEDLSLGMGAARYRGEDDHLIAIFKQFTRVREIDTLTVHQNRVIILQPHVIR